jgi:hypothetical protein
MFSRETMMAQLQNGNLGMMRRSSFGVLFARAEALMLMDGGPSEALESRLSYALENVTPTQRENAERFEAWVHAQSVKVG